MKRLPSQGRGVPQQRKETADFFEQRLLAGACDLLGRTLKAVLFAFLPVGLFLSIAVGFALPPVALHLLATSPGGFSLSPAGVLGFFGFLVAYAGISSFVQYRYYWGQRGRKLTEWKAQPAIPGSVGAAAETPWFPWAVAVGWAPPKCTRQENHWLVGSINIVTVAGSGALALELMLRGSTNVVPPWEDASSLWCGDSLLGTIFAGLVGCMYFSFAEYYWHRAYHWPILYKNFHKWHHRNKSPEPFDDLYIHPVELLTMQSMMYFVTYLVPMPFASFIVYMTIVGIAGVLDHSGVDFRLGPYEARDHDGHHKHFVYNYGIITSHIDRLYGTYRDLSAEPPGGTGDM